VVAALAVAEGAAVVGCAHAAGALNCQVGAAAAAAAAGLLALHPYIQEVYFVADLGLQRAAAQIDRWQATGSHQSHHQPCCCCVRQGSSISSSVLPTPSAKITSLCEDDVGLARLCGRVELQFIQFERAEPLAPQLAHRTTSACRKVKVALVWVVESNMPTLLYVHVQLPSTV
jgi:hypothetical protein